MYRIVRTVGFARSLIVVPRCSVSGVNQSAEDFDVDLGQLVDSIGMDVRETQNQSFAKLLRHSKFMQLGDINGRLVIGKIVHRMQDDLYIDVGLKFNAVCKAPAVNGDDYYIGSRVLVRLHDTELSERFLGSKKDLTLLEADATLLRLLRAGPRKDKVVETEQQKPKVEQSS